MIFIVSGEGPSDLGSSRSGRGECSGDDFIRGPMSALIEKIADATAGFDFAAAGMEFVSERRRLEVSKQEFAGKYFRGKKRRDYERGYYFNEARALAWLAKAKSASAQCSVAPILFRDADSNERAGYAVIRKSIRDGFYEEGMEDFGVAMVPQPTSEAWLICALKSTPYQNCGELEQTLSGTGAGKHPAKEILETILAERSKTIDDLYDLINQNVISAYNIHMPSYDDFRGELESVVNKMLGNSHTSGN